MSYKVLLVSCSVEQKDYHSSSPTSVHTRLLEFESIGEVKDALARIPKEPIPGVYLIAYELYQE